MPSATINGITIAYEDTGDGRPLVLVHGHPFDRSMWRPQIERFGAAGYRVIAPDLRGYGASGVVPGKTPLTTFATDLAGLLDHLGVTGIVLGGLSMGGQIVMEFQRLFPERVRGLLLADTTDAADTEQGRQLRVETADRVLRDGMAAYADELLPRMLAADTIANRPEVAAHVLAMMRGTPAAGAAAALRGRAERPDYADVLAGVAVPAVVVGGTEDGYTTVDEMRAMTGRIPGASLTVIHGAGHMPNLERPEEFNRAVAALLGAVGDR
ncbi:alpha/beta fold hydrolase [Plantactinospora sp. GCM10030261]|uniref:alpha/beta fold hydrolase n=1 Tax=Plantactinospora sp. GCM10030261 TaxID=3273420 RepID=UPI00360F4A42